MKTKEVKKKLKDVSKRIKWDKRKIDQRGINNNNYKDLFRDIYTQDLKITEDSYNSDIKNIDTFLDILKSLLTLASSIWIASATIPQLNINSPVILTILSILIFVLFLLLYAKWKLSKYLKNKSLEIVIKMQEDILHVIKTNLDRDDEIIEEVDRNLKSNEKTLNEINKILVTEDKKLKKK